jgi:hypothetical protein
MGEYTFTADQIVSDAILSAYGTTGANKLHGNLNGIKSDYYVITFPNIMYASTWAQTCEITNFCTIEDIAPDTRDNMTFHSEVTITFAYDSYQDTADYYHRYNPNSGVSRSDQYILDNVARATDK